MRLIEVFPVCLFFAVSVDGFVTSLPYLEASFGSSIIWQLMQMPRLQGNLNTESFDSKSGALSLRSFPILFFAVSDFGEQCKVALGASYRPTVSIFLFFSKWISSKIQFSLFSERRTNFCGLSFSRQNHDSGLQPSFWLTNWKMRS